MKNLSTPKDKEFLNAVLRTDLTSFIIKTFQTVDGSQPYRHGIHIDLLSDRLEKCRKGKIKRLIINLPPRSLKSICASVAFSAWLHGQDPTARIICASYSSDLALKHARDCRAVMEADWYRDLFKKTRINKKKNTEEEFETTASGFRLSTSVGGTLTGRGGNYVIIDDPIKPQEALSAKKRETVIQWFNGTLYSRLDDKQEGVIIVIMQRVHVDDLTAHLLEKGGWEIISLPAIAETEETYNLEDGKKFSRKPGEALHPERESISTLKAIRATLGSFFYSAQYQQNPIAEGGNLVKWDWFRRYQTVPKKNGYRDKIIQSWDTAMTAHDGSDWSACSTWAVRGKEYYLMNVFRARMDFPTLKKKVMELKEQFGVETVIIEDKGTGTGLIQQLRAEQQIRPIPFKPEGSKEDRMAAQSALIEAGHVLIPEKAPWLNEFQAEILAFPHGRHDDQVDSLSQFLTWITKDRTGTISICPPVLFVGGVEQVF